MQTEGKKHTQTSNIHSDYTWAEIYHLHKKRACQIIHRIILKSQLRTSFCLSEQYKKTFQCLPSGGSWVANSAGKVKRA